MFRLDLGITPAEEFMSLAEAAKLLPAKQGIVHPYKLMQWATAGLHGVRLETVVTKSETILTTRAALLAFLKETARRRKLGVPEDCAEPKPLKRKRGVKIRKKSAV